VNAGLAHSLGYCSCMLQGALAALLSSAAVPTTPVLRPPPLTWIVAADWDDTIKAGGNGKLFGVRGVGQRVRGTYPGMVTLIAELDQCGVSAVCRQARITHKRSFQIWSANPFTNKKPSSSVPFLHSKPHTRKGSKLGGLAWALSNWAVPQPLRPLALERGARLLADAKYRAFKKTIGKRSDSRTEIIFFGDSAQGDVVAARRMVEDEQGGKRVYCFIHDLTREVLPSREPAFIDERIAIKRPFGTAAEEGGSEAWRSPQLRFYQTVPEASYLLAQLGFLERAALRRVVEAARRECVGCQAVVDECTITRLEQEGRDSSSYEELIVRDMAACEALLACDSFWEADGDGVACTPPVATEFAPSELAEACVRKSERACRRAARAAAFREYAEGQWRRRLRA